MPKIKVPSAWIIVDNFSNEVIGVFNTEKDAEAFAAYMQDLKTMESDECYQYEVEEVPHYKTIDKGIKANPTPEAIRVVYQLCSGRTELKGLVYEEQPFLIKASQVFMTVIVDNKSPDGITRDIKFDMIIPFSIKDDESEIIKRATRVAKMSVWHLNSEFGISISDLMVDPKRVLEAKKYLPDLTECKDNTSYYRVNLGFDPYYMAKVL